MNKRCAPKGGRAHWLLYRLSVDPFGINIIEVMTI